MDHSGLVYAIKDRIANVLKLLQTGKRRYSNLVDFTHKHDVNEYASISTLPNSNLLSKNAQSILHCEENNHNIYFEDFLSLLNIKKIIVNEELLTNKFQVPEQIFLSALSSLNAHYVAAVADNDLLHHGITVYNIDSVAYIYANVNNIQKNVLLIGNKYLPNIQYRIIKIIVS